MELAGGNIQRLPKGEPGRIGNNDMTNGIHPAPPARPGHLLEFIGNEKTAPPSVPLAHAATDATVRAGMLMPRAQSIGGKHDLHEAAGKEHLDERFRMGSSPA